MPTDRDRHAAEILQAALGYGGNERRAFLDRQCAGDAALRAEVESLLAAGATADKFLEPPVRGFANATAFDAERFVGERVGPYKIRRLIQSGGMGNVYEALQERPRRPVALKLIRGGLASPSALRRFVYESQILARLSHPAIAQVYEAGTHESGGTVMPYFAMEYVAGALPIAEYSDKARLTLRQRLELFAGVCDAVHHGHQRGVIHRDLKPSNILVDSAGHAKVIDFGVARSIDSDLADVSVQTSYGQLVGTLPYMSPEQCAADPRDLDVRSDVYSLGVVMYELLCGRMPYDVSHLPALEAARVVCEQAPKRASKVNRMVRGDLETIVHTAFEKERARRYQSVAELAQDIRRFLGGQPVAAHPPSVVYQLRTFARRNKAAVAGVAAVFLILAGGTIILSALLARAIAAERLATYEQQKADKARRTAETVTDYLANVLASVSPEDLGREVLVRDVLDKASGTVGALYAGEPLIEARLGEAIGMSYRSLGEHSEAEPHFRRAVELYEGALGPGHVRTLSAMEALADACVQQADYGEAQRLYEQLLDLFERQEPQDEASVARIMSRLAWSYSLVGRPRAAEPLLVRALDIKRRILGAMHEETLLTLTELAAVYAVTERTVEAEALYLEGLVGLRAVLGDNHRWTLYATGGLGDLYTQQGRYVEAEPLHRTRQDVSRKVLGEQHPDTLIAGIAVADLRRAQGRLDEAQCLYDDLLTACRRILGSRHSLTLWVMNGLAWTYDARGRHEEALPLFAEAVNTARGINEDESWLLGWYLFAHGQCLASLHRYGEAEAELREAFEKLSRTLGSDSRRAAEVANGLVALYETWAYPELAAEWRAKLRRGGQSPQQGGGNPG